MTGLPDDRPRSWPEHARGQIGSYQFVRLHRDVESEPRGGAVWEREDEQVNISQRHDGSWSVEAYPVNRAKDYGGKTYDEVVVYKGDAEHGLTRGEAFDLAVRYMRGKAELTQPTVMELVNRGESRGEPQREIADFAGGGA